MLNSVPEPDFGSFFSMLDDFINGLNYFWYMLFCYGNYMMFFAFFVMGIILYLNAREKEYDEMIHGKIELVKKRGRAGSAICILIAFAFLSTHFTTFLYDVIKNVPEPQLIVRYVGDKLITTNSLEEIHALNLHERFFFLLIGFISLVSILLIAIGLYLMFFNKFILRSKLKFLSFIGVGLFFWVLVGFKASLRLIV